jgi:hypothetical protein
MPIRILGWEFSDTFEQLYREELRKMDKGFRWELDSSLPSGISARAREVYDGDVLVDRVILMRPSLPANVAEMMAAEEIMHFILYAEGYPSAMAKKPWNEIAGAFTSMVLDPIIHRRLSEYGFDMSMIEEREFQRLMREIDEIDDESSFSAIGRTHAIIIYASKCLEFRPELKRQFRDAFNTRLPAMAKEGDTIVDLVESSCYETPKKCWALMLQLRTRLGLDKIFEIVDERTGERY